MARHKMTMAQRIKGARAAIASRKTPANLKKGLRKYLRKLGVAACLLFALASFAAPRAAAQFIGYVSPQTVQKGYQVTCTSTPAATTVPNIGQSLHFVSFLTNNGNVPVTIYLAGISLNNPGPAQISATARARRSSMRWMQP